MRFHKSFSNNYSHGARHRIPKVDSINDRNCKIRLCSLALRCICRNKKFEIKYNKIIMAIKDLINAKVKA